MSANALDQLLRMELPEPREKKIKVKRLSEHLGEDFCLTLRELTFSRIAEIRKWHGEDGTEDIHVMLAGVAEPNLRDEQLLSRYGTATPDLLVQKLFLPGEITQISIAIEKLSGYRSQTIEEIKKN